MAAKKTTFDVIEIRRAAYSMIANHGRLAGEIALRRARNLGDDAIEARQTWERIVRSISEIEGQKVGVPA